MQHLSVELMNLKLQNYFKYPNKSMVCSAKCYLFCNHVWLPLGSNRKLVCFVRIKLKVVMYKWNNLLALDQNDQAFIVLLFSTFVSKCTLHCSFGKHGSGGEADKIFIWFLLQVQWVPKNQTCPVFRQSKRVQFFKFTIFLNVLFSNSCPKNWFCTIFRHYSHLSPSLCLS